MKPAPFFCMVGLTACASQPVTWSKPGASDAAVRDDTQSCHTKARLAPSDRPKPPPSPYAASMALSAADTRERFEQGEFRKCMEEKGYTQGR